MLCVQTWPSRRGNGTLTTAFSVFPLQSFRREIKFWVETFQRFWADSQKMRSYMEMQTAVKTAANGQIFSVRFLHVFMPLMQIFRSVK